MVTEKLINDNLLIDSYIVIKSDLMINTGKISYIDGDFLELEMDSTKIFGIGEKVHATIYTKGGSVRFETYIIAILPNHIMTLLPKETQSKLMLRRKDFRVNLNDTNGSIHMINNQKDLISFDTPLSIQIANISVGGIGFNMDVPVTISQGYKLDLTVLLDSVTTVSCQVEVVHKKLPRLFGAKYINSSQKTVNTILAFILREQIKDREKFHKFSTQDELEVR